MSSSRPSLPDIDAIIALSERFERALAADPGLAGAEPDQLLRHVPGKRAILSGDYNGRPAYFRVCLGADTQTPAREWAEMTRVWPRMCTGPYRIAEPLHHSPDHGIIVIGAATGTPLLKKLWKTEPGARAAYLGPAAGWLRHYAQGSIRPHPAAHRNWLNRAEIAAARQPHPGLRAREHDLRARLHALAPRLDGRDWRVGVSHGDFHPNNLIVQDGQLTGIDTGGSARLPIYKDMARFLMHMGRRGMIPSGEALYGVDRQGIAAFTRAFDLSGPEESLFLPFMLGCEALLRVESRNIKPGRLRHAADMYDRLIADLDRLAVSAP